MATTILHFLETKASSTTERGAERAAMILRAAQDMVIEQGFANLSMRGLASRVGMSVGNLQHYYASKEQLLTSLVLFIMDSLQSKMGMAFRKEDSTPRQRLSESIRILIGEVQVPRTAVVFVEIWTLSSRPGLAADIVGKVQIRELKAMKNLLREIPEASQAPGIDTRAAMMILVIEGLAVQACRTSASALTRKALAAAAHGTIMKIACENIQVK